MRRCLVKVIAGILVTGYIEVHLLAHISSVPLCKHGDITGNEMLCCALGLAGRLP
jgi:hypothetical protein